VIVIARDLQERGDLALLPARVAEAQRLREKKRGDEGPRLLVLDRAELLGGASAQPVERVFVRL
jgi:hypothetical protein